MASLNETPAPAVAPLITGYFQENPGYATWRPRGTRDYLLMFTVGGQGRIGYGAGEILVSPGDIVLIRPGMRHDYGTARGASGWELLWTHFLPRSHWLDWLDWPEPTPGIGIISLGAEGEARTGVEMALTEMNRRARGGSPRREAWAMNALEAALLWCDAANPRSARAQIDPRIAQATEYLLERLREPVSLTELAQVVGSSSSRLSHLFREQTGQAPQQFVERERIARAKQLLLLTSRTIAAVALEVGFENPFYFTLRFKRHTGLSPRDWRLHHLCESQSEPEESIERKAFTTAPGTGESIGFE